ncbi:AIPR family protein [Marinobacter nauticus]|uniref:AIPR family protein n=1 Tax=Marinobacter nauticus TaxID=2743 RepID=UPI004043F698
MPALKTPMLEALKKLLKDRFVSHLLPLLGDGNPADRENKQISRAFSAFALQKLFDLDTMTAAKAVVDDYNDKGIDAIYYHEDEKTLYLVQSKLKASEQFKLDEAQSFLSGVEFILDKDFDQFNQNVKNIQQKIEGALDECDKIQLLIAYSGEGISIQAKNEIHKKVQSLIEDGEEQLVLEPVIFGPEAIEEALRAENASKAINEKIQVHKFRTTSQPRYSVFGLVKVEDLIALHKKYGRALYEKNIRYFIGAGRRGVNSAIRDTLLNAPQNFMHLNNGITLVGTHVEAKSRVKGSTLTKNIQVLGLSVVNGAQTISSAAQFLEQTPEADISRAQVMVTIINTGNDDFHKQVTKARNLQNPVDLSNFAVLDDNQERLRQEMALFGFDYQYRPQRQTTTGVPIITIDNLAKALACLHNDIRFPARLKSEPSQFTNSSSDSYQALFTTELTGHKALNAHTTFEAIHELVTQAERGSPSPEKLVYRHCGYAIASILMKQLRRKIEGNELLVADNVRQRLSMPFDEVRQRFADLYPAVAMGLAPHAFFKRIPDTAKLINKVWIEHQGLQQDASVTALQGTLSSDDPYNQRLFNVLKDRAAQL